MTGLSKEQRSRFHLWYASGEARAIRLSLCASPKSGGGFFSPSA
jgi:hypothetical protein